MRLALQHHCLDDPALGAQADIPQQPLLTTLCHADYLRDNLTGTKGALVLRAFNYCIIDEVDSILIDEARTPLIISGPAGVIQECKCSW